MAKVKLKNGKEYKYERWALSHHKGEQYDIRIEIPRTKGMRTPLKPTITKIKDEIKKLHPDFNPEIAIAYPGVFGWSSYIAIHYFAKAPENPEHTRPDEFHRGPRRIVVDFRNPEN